MSARPSVQDVKELEAQKEVLLSMLLRLIQYPEVSQLAADGVVCVYKLCTLVFIDVRWGDCWIRQIELPKLTL